MSEVSNLTVTASLLHNIESAERRLRLLRQYINPQNGTVNSVDLACNTFYGIEENVENLRKGLEKFV
jgi:hypothetical protein